MSYILLPKIRLFDYEDDMFVLPLETINNDYIDDLLINCNYQIAYDTFGNPSHFYLDRAYTDAPIINL